ncbi:MAG: YigZ family protein [Oscillospiraceae bacterium]
MEGYLIPAGYGEDEFTEKRSRFIGRVWHTPTEEEALAHIKKMREQHWDATHNVYAYAIKNGNIMRYSDDGEPSGTSGMPVLNVFRSAGIQDFCCVVTRYFGGILLGAGGLVRAYTKGASIALEAAGRAEMRKLLSVSVICTYPQYERIKSELSRFEAAVEATGFGADVELTLSMTPENADRFLPRVTELTAGTAIAEITGESLRPVKIG